MTTERTGAETTEGGWVCWRSGEGRGMREMPQHAKVLPERDDAPLANTVDYATTDTSIVLHCPACETFIALGPLTGPHRLNLPWLAELCPTCGARFRAVQCIEITWQP